MNKLKISVVICTYNRAEHLRKAIKSLEDQSLAKEQYEVLVIDNCSTDDTAKIVNEEYSHIKNLRYLYEEALGLSHARNRGFKEAVAEIVAFLDDDAIADPEWLRVLCMAFETVTPQPLCIGGKVEPNFEIPKPAWIPPSLRGLPVTKLNDEARWIDFPKEFIIGANIAFRRNYLLNTGGFNPSLGRQGNNLLSNEETEVLRDVNSKLGIYYEPKAIVQHFIEADRLRIRYFIKRFYWQGISDCRSGHIIKGKMVKRYTVIRNIFNKIVLALKHLISLPITSDVEKKFTSLFRVIHSFGYIVEEMKFLIMGKVYLK